MSQISPVWTELVDPNSGTKYYFNSETQVTQWTWPEDVPQPDKAEGTSGAEWLPKVDPTSGQTYYVNINTGESAWTLPEGAEVAADPNESASTEVEAEAANSSEWAAQVDPTSGSTYYVNLVSGESAWTLPEDGVLVKAETDDEPTTEEAEEKEENEPENITAKEEEEEANKEEVPEASVDEVTVKTDEMKVSEEPKEEEKEEEKPTVEEVAPKKGNNPVIEEEEPKEEEKIVEEPKKDEPEKIEEKKEAKNPVTTSSSNPVVNPVSVIEEDDKEEKVEEEKEVEKKKIEEKIVEKKEEKKVEEKKEENDEKKIEKKEEEKKVEKKEETETEEKEEAVEIEEDKEKRTLKKKTKNGSSMIITPRGKKRKGKKKKSKDEAGRFERLRNFEENKEARKAEKDEDIKKKDALSDKVFKERLDKLLVQGILKTFKPTSKDVTMEQFAEENFNLKRKGFFGRKTQVEKVLGWKKDIIRTSLLTLPKELIAVAVQCFRNITGYMGDRNTSKEGEGHAYKLLKNCLHAPEELRDEVYCQLVKQTTRNPDLQSRLKGWELMSVLAGSFPPTELLEPFLLSYCADCATDRKSNPKVRTYAKHVSLKLERVTELGARRETSTSIEVEAAKDLSPVAVRVHLLGDRSLIVPVESWTTASELVRIVCATLKIGDHQPFGIFETNQNGEERILEDDERVLDLVAYWQRVFDEGKEKADKKNGGERFKFVFKVVYYLNIAEEDLAGQKELFMQAVYDVVSNRYPCTEKDCLTLAALQLQATLGDAPDEAEGYFYISDPTLREILPAKLLEDGRGVELKTAISNYHRKLNGISKDDAMQSHLDFVKQWKIYGSSFFFVEPQMSSTLPPEAFLAVNPHGVLIINPDTKETLFDYAYAELPTWGHSEASFVLHVGTLMQQEKLVFKTDQGKEINTLIGTYVSHLCNS
eukprot:TRINITY_DN3303_c0_g1_i1.p1 TRINITY_DN3303_c0_g1~~TRINITY_DN3303_c0_g1_i1.p1  ORF type:complete len:930 (-),score=396.95 TRINITY_DN3303_c0_g1_i1:530-3319(-)